MPTAIVCDTETSGLPRGRKRAPEDILTILEFGAVVTDDKFNILDEFEILVNPGRYIIDHPVVQKIYELTGLSPELLLSEGVRPDVAAERSAVWVNAMQEKHGCRFILAYNRDFDRGFLERSPWDFSQRTAIKWGRDIMEASTKILGQAGKLPPPHSFIKMKHPEQRWKWANAGEAAQYFREIGYPIPDYGGQQHRALPDSRVEAAIMVAAQLEEKSLAE